MLIYLYSDFFWACQLNTLRSTKTQPFIKSSRKSTKKDSCKFDAKVKWNQSREFVPNSSNHLRSQENLPTRVVYSLQIVADCQELLEDYDLTRRLFEMYHTSK